MLPAGIAAVLALPTLARTVFVVRPGPSATSDGSVEPAGVATDERAGAATRTP
jgi:hypothetical protein